jgi:hypothetical protein
MEGIDLTGARCAVAVGPDPVADVLSVEVELKPPLEVDAAYHGANAYTLHLRINHPGILVLEADPACLGRDVPPGNALEVLP